MKNKVHEAKEQLTEVKKTKAYVVKEGTITATKKMYGLSGIMVQL